MARKNNVSPIPALLSPASLPDGKGFFTGRLIATWLIPIYVLLISFSTLVLHQSWSLASGSMMNFDRATFTAVNAVTLTGFQQIVNVDQYALPGQITVFVLTVIGSGLALFIGGLGVVRSMRLPYSTGQVLLATVTFQISLALLGTVILFAGDRDLFQAFFQSTSAMANSGLIVGRLPLADSVQTLLCLVPLSWLGGLGLPVFMELYDLAFKRRPLSRYSQAVLGLSGVAFLIAFVAFFGLTFVEGGTKDLDSIRHGAGSAVILAINSRSAGFPFDSVAMLPRTVQWMAIVAMSIGACPGGTAGGLKITSVHQLVSGIHRTLEGKPAGRGFAVALLWLGIYVVIVVVCFMMTLSLNPQTPADRLLFVAASAAGNCGLAFDEISTGSSTMYIMSATMLLGRVLPLLILWRTVDRRDEMELPIG